VGLEVLQDAVHRVDRDVLQAGDRLGDRLDIVFAEMFHHLAGGFLSQSDHDDGDFLRERKIHIAFVLGLRVGHFV